MVRKTALAVKCFETPPVFYADGVGPRRLSKEGIFSGFLANPGDLPNDDRLRNNHRPLGQDEVLR